MSLLHGLWVPIAYKVAPIWLGQHALRGFLKHRGVDLLGVPLPLSRALAEHCYPLAKWMKHPGAFGEISAYTEILETTADQVAALLYMREHRIDLRDNCSTVKSILERHGVSVPTLE